VASDTHPRPVASLCIEVPAIAERLAEIRRQLATWLRPIGVSTAGVADIVLVVNEACTNAVEHAYRGIEHGLMRVEANYDGGQILVDIADSGVWREPTVPGTRGRGLPIMRTVADGVDLNTSSEGTTVRMRFAARFQACGRRTT
jgi:serine/threonine-protein kinase RsbW